MRGFWQEIKKRQLFWNMAELAGRFLPGSYFRKLPGVIKFESTNVCNLRCPVCPTNFAITRPRGFLDFELFKQVIDEFSGLDKKPKIAFSMTGEPLLNEEMPRFIEYASIKGHRTYISTNATQLDEELSEKMIRAGLSTIHLALEGIKKESHEAYRIGSDFEQVKKNMEHFLAKKKQLKSPTPRVVIQTLLTSFSELEIHEITAWAKNHNADLIAFKSLSMGSYTDEGRKNEYSYLLPKNPRFLRAKKTSVKRKVCRRPLMETVIYWDGTLGLCCVDFNGECSLPNIKEKGFMATWKSKEVFRARKLGVLKKHGLCTGCSLGGADYGGFSVDLTKEIPRQD